MTVKNSAKNWLKLVYLEQGGGSGEGGLLSLPLLVTGHVLHSSHVKHDGSYLWAKREKYKADLLFSAADPDPGSGAFLTPGSGIGFSRIPNSYFESLVITFWVKSSIILWNLAHIVFFSSSKK
jgi:hypothetical protein